ncbi:putative Alpha-(1: CLUMA_CG015321, isoform A [Gryllus bimaculatus]|nr:putative Alpha-(1: CLUMA_CG015321, isoform A [Gryllus bimaculatus]
MTYRLDSDVPFSLGEVVPRGPVPPRSKGWLRPPAMPIGLAEVLDRSLPSGDNSDFFYWTSAPKNDRIAVWVFNECQSSSWRKKVVDQLATYITVDVFTSCGRFTQKVETIPENLIKKYKFYLVFEESFCRSRRLQQWRWNLPN